MFAKIRKERFDFGDYLFNLIYIRNVDDEDVSVVALFDHEEVGSDSYSGAGSTLISDAIERISYALAGNNAQVNIELDKAARQR